ncbi:hypothetical protein [Xanthomonas arboricola]|uniref:hypothetical protein n=1 Tax=Xanthomonas arboricola TaxID=56448 RepID=UPI000F8D52D4|nr:hypothetical protein [Xanthomonas arboricola]
MSTETTCTCPSGDGSLRWPCPAHPSHMGQLHQHLLDLLGAKDHVDAGRIIGELHAAALNEQSGNSGQLQQPGAAAGLNEPFGDSEQLAPRALEYALGRLDREAPQRVWLQIDTAGDNSERDVPWPGSEHVTWQDESIGGLEVEYVRADLAGQPDVVSGGDALDVPFAWTWISQAGERHVTTYERHARHIARADGCVVHAITPQMLTARQPVGAEVPNGKPTWQSHNWAQIFQSEQGYWFGTVAGWDLSAHISDGFKGRSVNLLRSDGQFLAYDSYNPDWENSLEIRPIAPAAAVQPNISHNASEIEDPCDVITRAAQKLAAAGQPRLADRLVRACDEVEQLQAAALAARQAAQVGNVTGWQMIDGMTVFDVASHSGIVEPQQFVRYADYLAARQQVGVELFGWWLKDERGNGYLARNPAKGAIDAYQERPDCSAIPLYTVRPAPAAVPVDGEVSVIEALLDLAFAAWSLADDAEDNDETLTVDRAGFDKLSECLDKLDALPDDQPGYIMEAAAKARWALRRLLATHPQPAAADELRTATEQRNQLAEAIAKAAVKSGIYREQPMTGPQLLMACDDMAECIKSAAAGGDA